MSKPLSANQKTFNKAARHLLKQGKRAKIGGFCKYRGDEGTKCAVGCLIPNRLYNPGIEGLSAGNAEVARILNELGHDITLCKSLQMVHDMWEPQNWTEGLNVVAREFNLKMPK